MKLLTIIKSILTSPLFRKSIALGFLLWIIFAIPGYVLTWHYLVDNEVHKNNEQRIANEIILANIFESQARFGDAVNARGFIIEKAKPLGLLNLLICDGTQPILATLSTEKCPTHNNFVPVLISGKILHLFFIWQDVKLSNAKILGAALSVSLLIVSFLVFSVAISMYLLTRRSLKDFSDKLFNLAATDGIPDFPSFPEVTPIVDALKSLKNKLYDFQQKEIDMLIAKKTSDIAKQVSHDIRSPLAALNMVVGDLDQVAEEKRILIRNSVSRINDIANTLLTKSKNIDNEYTTQEAQMTTELLPALVDSIVSEKRVQYREKTGVTIETDLKNSYGAFALVNATDLKRVISNLINNSVEAVQLDSVTITVAVRIDENKIKINIKDNGKGIPSSILSQLGLTTISYGKENADNNSGSGLGIFHAKKSIENSHGEMNIESIEGVSTTISISFPRSKIPEWFVEKIVIHRHQKVVIIDDDATIHQAWQGRFDQLAELVKFSSAIDFETWLNSQKNQPVEELLFLFDYELGKLAMTGLDLIEKYQLQNKSILVTSRYEEPAIKTRAEHLKLKIIPKGMIGFIAIEIANLNPVIDKIYTRCLIDDDALVRMTWEWAAKKDSIKLLTCDSLKSFQEQIAKVNFETEIYIDVHLAEDVKGQAVASTLHNQGFKKLYFATGYDAKALTDVPDYILGVTGKDPVRNN